MLDRVVERALRITPSTLQRRLAGGSQAEPIVYWSETYEWPSAATWLDPIRRGFETIATVRRTPVASPAPGVYPAILQIAGRSHAIAIDIADTVELDPAHATSYVAYFKMQYRRGGYGLDNVFPGGFIPASREIDGWLPYLRALRDRSGFRNDVTARFGLEFEAGLRREVVERLRREPALRYPGGAKIRYSKALREVATSRVAIDLPGNGPMCFRLIDYMAVGACIIAYPHAAELPVPLRDGVHLVYMREDLSDLVELCRYFASHDAERERLCLASRQYYDQHLRPDRLARYYLATVLERLATAPSPALAASATGHR